jgi:hypothetical protein
MSCIRLTWQLSNGGFARKAVLGASCSESLHSALGVDAVVQKLIFTRLQRMLTLSAVCEFDL